MSAERTINTGSQHWGTPHKYVKAVREVFQGEIDLDPCSNQYSIVGANTEFMLPKHDGLKEEWNYRKIYVNPPYGIDKQRGTTIKNWLAKCAHTHSAYGSEVSALVPIAANTSHWKQYLRRYIITEKGAYLQAVDGTTLGLFADLAKSTTFIVRGIVKVIVQYP